MQKAFGKRSREDLRNPVKCPKCGFVSFPGLIHCKKCGHQLASPGVPQPSGEPLAAPSPPDARELEQAATGAAEDASLLLEPSPSGSRRYEPITLDLPLADTSPDPGEGADDAKPWQEEISERVENFRRRRSRQGEGAARSLEFDFSSEEPDSAPGQIDAGVIEFPKPMDNLDVAFKRLAGEEAGLPLVDSLLLGGHPDSPSPGDSRLHGGMSFGAAKDAASAAPVEVYLDSVPSIAAGEVDAAAPVPRSAPLGRRFLAGTLDTVVLLAAAGVFVLIFWLAGGHMSGQPLNMAVVGFTTTFILLGYFGLSITFTSTTPGLLWMGLEVRNLEGRFPTPREAFWRAFGYLVSSAALMLGFVWALVDSEGLTWHDRISGTFLAASESDHGAQRQTAG